MKLIQAMKQIKELARKKDDIIAKIKQHCADYDFEQPVYENQKAEIDKWLQSIFDINKKILELRIAVQRTNLATMVTITLGDKDVTKSIAEWIHRRKDLATSDMLAWQALTDRGLKDQKTTSTQGVIVEMKVRRYFNPAQRDEKIALFRSEPHIIDSTLEVVNATTDLMEE